MRSCVTLTAAEGHVIFLSFVSMAVKGRECDSDPSTRYDSEYLALYSGPCWRSSDLVWKTLHHAAPCSLPPPVPVRLHLSLLRQQQNQQQQQQQPASGAARGIQGPVLFFTTSRRHQSSFLTGCGNCSVKHWLDFQQHFPCDLVPQCAGGEDEARCPYTSDRCGPGNIDVGGRCYNYVMPRVAITWNDASYACSSRGTIFGQSGVSSRVGRRHRVATSERF